MDDSSNQEFAEGFVPVIRTSGDVSVRDAGALLIVAGGDASLNEGGAGSLIVGGDVKMSQAGSGNMIIGGGVEMSDSAVGQMLTIEGTVADSRIGVLLAANANIENSEIFLGTPQAIGLGVAMGATVFLLARLLRQR